MVDQKDPRIGCTKEEMMMRIENYLPYLTDNDLKVISVQLYNISKRRQDIQRQQAMLEGTAGGPLGGTVAGITRLATPDTVTPQPDIVTPPDTTEVVAEAKEPDIVPKVEVTEETKIPPFATDEEFTAYQARQKEEAYQVKRAESDKLKAEKEAAMSDEEKAEAKETARLTTVYTELSALTKDVREGVIGNSYEEWNTEKKYRGIIAKLRGSRIKGFKKEFVETAIASNYKNL